MASKLSPATPRPRVQKEASGLAGERIASPSSKIGSGGVVGERNGKATPPDRRSPRLFSADVNFMIRIVSFKNYFIASHVTKHTRNHTLTEAN